MWAPSPDLAAGIRTVKGAKKIGVLRKLADRTVAEPLAVSRWRASARASPSGGRLALLLAGGLRRQESV
jgi:hypothetical protein